MCVLAPFFNTKKKALHLRVTINGVWIGNLVHSLLKVRILLSLFYTLYSSLWHALSLLSQLFLYQSSGNGIQRQTSPSSGFLNWSHDSATAILCYLLNNHTFSRTVLDLISIHHSRRWSLHWIQLKWTHSELKAISCQVKVKSNLYYSWQSASLSWC
jgi:hypothetical protein